MDTQLTMTCELVLPQCTVNMLGEVYFRTIQYSGAVVAQLASARLSEREVSGSIFSDVNVCFDFPLIRVAMALNTRKTEN